MFKKLSMICAAAACISCLAAEPVPAAQSLPKNGYLTVTSGDYTVTFLPTSNYRISGFAFKNNELFISRGSASGTNLIPAAAEKLVSAKVTVDGNMPEKVTFAPVKGNKVELEREAVFGDVRVFSKYTVTPEGLSWSIKYKLDTAAKKPSYFYLYTMSWGTKFTEFVYSKKGVNKSGKLSGSGNWFINDDLEYMAMYDPSRKIAAIAVMPVQIPGEMRKNAIWDHKTYHKYFMMHKRPVWQAGYESSEYTMQFAAVAAENANWQKNVEEFIKSKGK